MTGVILFQPALTKLTVTTGQDSGLPFSSDLACQLPLLRFQVSYPLINGSSNYSQFKPLLHFKDKPNHKCGPYRVRCTDHFQTLT